jgi:PAS domain S-box-containing protein
MRQYSVKFVGQLTPVQESDRLQALHDYDILDSLPEQEFEDITDLAACICGTPTSLISLVDHDRQWFKSAHGFDSTETPRTQSFCTYTLADAQTLIVPDACADPRFSDNPLVVGGANVRFYAGAPIVEENGHVLGTVCVIDTQPRVLSAAQISALEALARHAMTLFEQRKVIADLKASIAESSAKTRSSLGTNNLQAFVDLLPALAWIADADGSITWYNRRWYEYTGTTEDAMAGYGWQSVHDPELLPAVLEKYTASIRTRQPFEMVFPLRGKDGVYRSFMTRMVPIRDEAGAAVQWFGTNTEVDELQRTRHALEESEAGLNHVLTATSDAVISMNRDWVVTYVNPAAEKLYKTSGLTGKNIWEAFPEAAYEGSPIVEHCQRAMHERTVVRFEAALSDPFQFTIGVELYPSKDGIVSFSRDITQIKQTTAALMQSEKLAAVGRLASSIAHEINNPLESVTNLLYLARSTREPQVLEEYLDIAERELRRVSAITNQTLRFYKQTTRPQPVDCGALFQETVALYQSKLANARISVEIRDRCERDAICFEGEIRQVLSNLVGNAIDAMPSSGGRILLRSHELTDSNSGEKYLAITIADTGAGIPPKLRERIFDAFFSTKGLGGTGLGLWVSKEIVDRHHGRLLVRSSQDPIHHGTIFTLLLPFDLPPDEPAQPAIR